MYLAMLAVEEQEQIVRALRGPQFDRRTHGCLHGRGAADSYYHRGPKPHYYVNGHWSTRVDVTDTVSIAEYMAGYEDNENFGDKKDWG